MKFHFLSDIAAKQKLYSQHQAQPSFMRVLFSDGTLANLLFRAQTFFSEIKIFPLALFFHILNKYINGCVIGLGARFESGFVLIHPIGVVINSSVRGGNNVWLESAVVIGDNNGRSPVLGNDIFVGSGAKIIGGLSIGDRVRIGANAVVLINLPDDCTAVGVPARILPTKVNH
jgi:serine O-acetyltransferase